MVGRSSPFYSAADLPALWPKGLRAISVSSVGISPCAGGRLPEDVWGWDLGAAAMP
jgi:hypothetical protein